MRKQSCLSAALAGLLMLTTPLLAATEESTSSTLNDPATFAQINGKAISLDMFNFLLHSREQEDMQDMSEAIDNNTRKQQVTRDIILTTLLAEQAQQSNLHSSEQFKLEKELFEQTLLAQLFVQQHMAAMAIDEASLRQRHAELQAQTLYRFNIWETTDQATAKRALSTLQQASGTTLPMDSISAIETPWLMSTDIDPAVDQQVRPLTVNDFIEAPIYQDGVWKVVQLIDKRSLPRQSFAEEREAIEADMVAEQLDALFESLLNDASIVINQDYAAKPVQQ